MLTAKQEKFVQNIVFEEMTQADAYRSAYNAEKMTDKTINEKASILANKDNIRARMAELRGEMTTPKVMTAQKRLEWLTNVVQSDETSVGDKLKAVDLMNKMQGEYVQKVQAEVTNAVNISIELSDD